MEQQNSLKPSSYRKVLESLLSIQDKFSSKPKLYINSKTSFEKKESEEKIYSILVFFSAAIQAYRSSNVFQNINIFRNTRKKQKFVQKKPLCVTNVDLNQIFIQLCDLMDPHLEELKQISFFYINNFNKTNSVFSFIKETENNKDENTSFVLQSSENDSKESIANENDSNALEESPNGTQFDEETNFFLQYPDGEKQRGNSEDLFDMNEMKKFVEQAENMDFDEESLLEESNPKVWNKKDQALEKLLDEYEEKNRELPKHSQKCKDDDDDSTNANEKDCYVDDSDEDIHTLENVDQNMQDLSKLSKTNGTSTVQKQKEEESHLLHLVKKNDILNDLLETTERELVEEKHWTMKGEVSAKAREQNSLLEVHLDVPQYNHHYQSEDVLGTNKSAWNNEEFNERQHHSLTLKETETPSYSSLSAEIEKIVLYRIRYLLFDDVVRKYEKPNAEREKDHNDAETEILNFQKNQNGLAEVYADYYTKQVLDGVTNADVKLNEKCTQMSHLFNTIMYKLDALSSHRVMRKPIVHKGEIPDNVPSVTVEDTIPAVVSDNQRKAPQEMFEPGTLKKREEMTQEEKKSLRRLHKARRKNRLHNFLMTGQTTLQQNVKRSMDLHRKNKDEKEKRKRTKNTGIATEMQHSKLSRTKRLRTADFITNAVIST